MSGSHIPRRSTEEHAQRAGLIFTEVTGLHSVQKALLYALLEPKTLKALQDANNFTELMVRQEELKTMPFGAVWEEYLRRENIPQDYFAEIKRYEADVLSKR